MVNSAANVVLQTNYPLYCVRTVGDRHVIVAGGGGQAKTGVPNRLEIFLFDLDAGSWEFRKTTAVDTGLEATMNMDVFPVEPDKGRFLIACGQEGNCRIYETCFDVAELRDGQLVTSSPSRAHSGSKKQRNRSSSSSSSGNVQQVNNGTVATGSSSSSSNAQKPTVLKCTLSFDLRSSFQTDFTPTNHKCGGPFQKVVRFGGANGASVITGGADGHFRLWDLQSGRKTLDHNAHKDDIDDLDCSPDGQRHVTVGRDGAGYLWSTKDATKLADLHKAGVAPAKYRFRFARFAPALCTQHTQIFFTVAIPVVRTSKKNSCYITKWSATTSVGAALCRPLVTRPLTPDNEVVSAFALTGDGQCLGLGTLNGSLMILDTGDLRELKSWRNAHGIFVTALEFLPSRNRFKPESSFCPLLTNARCALLSVSADDSGQLHVIPSASGRSLSTSFVIFMIFWAVIFYLLEYLEL